MKGSLKESPKPIKGSKVTIRKKKLHDRSKEITAVPASFILNRMKRLEGTGYIRQNIFGTEIIWSGSKLSFTTNKAKKSRKNLFIFALVKKDAVRFLDTYGVIKTKQLPAIHFNKHLKPGKRKIIGTDVNSAYWNIAYQMGVISESTYNHGIRIKDKNLCLAALASLGADKSYRAIKNGILTNDIVIVKGDDRLKDLYQSIRIKCFKYMQQLAKKLGNSFVAYKTDCIYYLDNPGNVKMAQKFFTDKKLEFKMVKEYDEFSKQ